MIMGRILFLGLILLMSNCTYDTIEIDEINDCIIDNHVKSKTEASTLIIGKWNWIKTTYTRRGVGITTETPFSTQKTLTYEFTGEKVRILEDSTLTEEYYEISFWGEGTNAVDDILVIKFFKLTEEFQGTSILLLSTSGTCLTLGNAYHDGGGDLNFKRVD